MKFHRYGSLSSSSYKREKGIINFHTPPLSKGIYAFPLYIDEAFLWAWKFKEKFEESEEKRKIRFQKWVKQIHKCFEYNGNIWHHLTDCCSILERRGTWGYSSIIEYKKAFHRTYARDRAESLRIFRECGGSLPDNVRFNPYCQNPCIKISVDHLEVFIEKNDLNGINT